ncbi:low-complexity tail membrane protein [Pleurocapsa sp. PCC 7319]|uniref:low-complexity tail membrane protein n=1 Tax=Pleurocapsa sp. PCC 7319 TaxID=118161 RepID=UPI000348BCD3|nr:low-complexity tail membrane protein [Pleurocapsa sp. PCC 7319]
MSTFRSEPFLWIHLSGIVLFPILLEIVLIGLATGDSFSYILELLLIAAFGIIPVLRMQLTCPFDIFSILLFSLNPESLTTEQTRILSLFKSNKQKLFAILAAGFMLLLLWLLYRLSPLAVALFDFIPQWRILGLIIATIAFFGSNLFLQVPLSVLLVLLTKQSQFAQIEPYPQDQIEQDFTVPGIKVSKILWFLKSDSDSKEIT